MDIVRLPISGLLEIRPRKISDERGYFAELFRESAFAAHAGAVTFVQENQSLSLCAGTIRGMHFQTPPAGQGKLVRCLAGKLLDVALDLRRGSRTYGRSASVMLSAEQANQLWIPVGFAHGFCTLEPNSIVSYRVTSYYSPENDKGVAWDDPVLANEWPEIADPQTLSAKDRLQPRLAELPAYFEWQAA
ncbi:MAG: dTDP-4-dehydrorhamnose 3,5-epimerase [Sphingomonas sp.]|nr:dTDP-4-dehydrorhamnose 3,5-epimerase [Sphingomonas sp.]